MHRTPLARRLALLAVLAVAPTVSGQAPTATTPAISGPAGTYFAATVMATPGPVTFGGTWSGPAGPYTFTLPAGCTIVQTATSITITWGPAPAPAAAAAVAAPAVTPASAFHIPTR